jgi:hypothetical protein
MPWQSDRRLDCRPNFSHRLFVRNDIAGFDIRQPALNALDNFDGFGFALGHWRS